MDTIYMLQPVIAFACWNLVMLAWMYATRILGMRQIKMPVAAARHPEDMAKLPSSARQVGDNYNQLFQAPTLFYATVMVIVLGGHVDSVFVNLAWAYVGFRVLHSLVQAIVNQVLARFSMFTLAWVVLVIMIVREAVQVFAAAPLI